MQLVQDDVAEVLEQLHPLRVVREDPLVEHVGVRDDDVGAGADRLARVLRRVAVVGEGADVGAEGLDGRVQLGELVLGERLGREEVERSHIRVLQDRVEDGKVVAERLAGGRRRDDHRAPPGPDGVAGLALVRVQPLDPARAQDLEELRMEVGREVRVAPGLGRKAAHRGEDGLGPQGALDLQGLEGRYQRSLGVFPVQDERMAHADLPGSGADCGSRASCHPRVTEQVRSGLPPRRKPGIDLEFVATGEREA
jgi:hypothetical protein